MMQPEPNWAAMRTRIMIVTGHSKDIVAREFYIFTCEPIREDDFVLAFLRDFTNKFDVEPSTLHSAVSDWAPDGWTVPSTEAPATQAQP